MTFNLPGIALPAKNFLAFYIVAASAAIPRYNNVGTLDARLVAGGVASTDGALQIRTPYSFVAPAPALATPFGGTPVLNTTDASGLGTGRLPVGLTVAYCTGTATASG